MSQRPSIFSTPVTYFLAVAIGFSVDFALYATMVAWGESVYLSNLAAFCVGTALNVFLIRRFVFRDSRFKFGTDLLLTILANGTMLGVGMGVLWVLVERGGVNPYLAKLVANGLTFVLNYATRATFFRLK